MNCPSKLLKELTDYINNMTIPYGGDIYQIRFNLMYDDVRINIKSCNRNKIMSNPLYLRTSAFWKMIWIDFEKEVMDYINEYHDDDDIFKSDFDGIFDYEEEYDEWCGYAGPQYKQQL